MGLQALVLCFVVSVAVVESSHFRGGVISWRTNATNVLVDYRVAFRTSFGPDHFCNSQTIQDGNYNPGEGMLMCDGGCLPSGLAQIKAFDYRCTDFSVDGDWTTGRGNSTFVPANGVNMFELYYEGRNWITLANGGNDRWVIRSRVDLDPRPDNSEINSSPTTDTMPIVRFQNTCPNRLVIPVADPDMDEVRCRWASDANDECGAICGSLDTSVLNETQCILTWTPTQEGLYGVAIQIEDYLQGVPLSSIPLQFLIEVFLGDGDCGSSPVFAPIVLPGDSCIAVPVGGTFTTRIQAAVSSPSRSIISINTVSPVGLTTSSVQQVPGSDVEYFIDVVFSAVSGQQIQEIFCFVAEDNGGLTSEQRCIFLVTATSPPRATAAVIDENNQLTITADIPINTPTTPRTIEVISDQSGQPIFTFDTSRDATVTGTGDSIVMQLPTSLPPGSTYSARLERGAIESNDFCGVENELSSLAITTATPPTGDCPMNISVVLAPNEMMAFVSWDAPNLGLRVAGPTQSSCFYPAGTDTLIRYIFLDEASEYIFCEFSIVVGPDPHVCPIDMEVFALRGSGGTVVTWTEPATPDRILSAPIPSGSFLTPGTTCVTYTFNRTNPDGAIDSCQFYVTVTEVDPCYNSTCQYGSTCVPTGVDSFRCICEGGCYLGEFCEIPIHSCASEPCQNGGTCELLEGSCTVSVCKCPPCYTGPTCETPIDACYGNLCKNGSECRAVEGSCDRYECVCEDCVFGAFCEFAVPNPCEDNPCGNGLVCAINPNNCYGYICLSDIPDPSCVSGGIEIPVSDKCRNSPCLNSAICVPTTKDETSDNSDGFTCLCPEGYAGYLCGEKIEDKPDLEACSNTTCVNGGVCYNSYTSFNSRYAACEYTCVCPGNTTGRDCSKPAGEKSPCTYGDYDPCTNGVCKNLFISPRNYANYYCACDAGYAGSRCNEQITDPCLSSPCFNDGSCEQRGRTFKCTCASGWYGPTCEIRIVDAPSPPLVLNCPEPIILSSDIPSAVQWVMPTALNLGFTAPARLVYANSAPGAVHVPGQLDMVKLVFEGSQGLRSTCEFWIYVDPITLIKPY